MSLQPGRPQPLGSVPEANADETTKRRYLQRLHSAVAYLMDKVTATTPQTDKTLSQFAAPATFGTNLYDSNGNLITSITGDLIGEGEINQTHLADNSIGPDAIQNAAVGSDHIATGSVTGDHVAEGSLDDTNVTSTQSLVSSGAVTVNPTSGVIQMDLSLSAAGTSTTAGIVNNDTANIGDSAGLGLSADANSITNLPSTVASAVALGIVTDAQTAIPAAAGNGYVLQRDQGGNIYCAPKFDNTMNDGVQALTDTSTSSASFAQYGSQTVVLANPNTNVNIKAKLVAGSSWSAGSDNPRTRLRVSTDGGSTFTNGLNNTGSRHSATTDHDSLGNSMALIGVTPTGDIWVQAQVSVLNASGTLSFVNGELEGVVRPNSNFGTVGTLSASIPSTAAMNCNSTSPVSTCTATCNVSVSIPTSVAPNFEAWAKSAGTGTLSGTATPTSTVTDTETTTKAGATATTTIACTVTDSQTYTSTAGSQSAGTATITIGAHNIPVGATVNASGFTPAAYNGTGVTVSAVTGTAIKYSVAGGPGAVTVQGTINHVSVVTGNCVVTGTYTKKFAAVSVSISTSGAAKAIGPTGSTITASSTLTGSATGGDGTFTWGNSKTAGSYTLVGSTTKSYTASESGTVPGTDSGTAKTVATDGETPANTGNATKTINFTWISNN